MVRIARGRMFEGGLGSAGIVMFGLAGLECGLVARRLLSLLKISAKTGSNTMPLINVALQETSLPDATIVNTNINTSNRVLTISTL